MGDRLASRAEVGNPTSTTTMRLNSYQAVPANIRQRISDLSEGYVILSVEGGDRAVNLFQRGGSLHLRQLNRRQYQGLLSNSLAIVLRPVGAGPIS